MSLTLTRPLPALLGTARADLAASLVVVLVAVPLSLGIALASGAPPAAGLIAAVAGGIVAGLLGGAPLQVSGPAAGITVLVAGTVAQYGWPVATLVTAGAGLLQLGFAAARLGRFAAAVPPAVVQGMLAGIGVTIAAGQVLVLGGGAAGATLLDDLLTLPTVLAHPRWHDLAVGGAALAVLLLWPRLPRAARAVPGPLVAVGIAGVLALAWPDVARVDLAGSLLDAVAAPVPPAADAWPGVLAAMLTLAIVTSVQTLLSAAAVDRMAGTTTDTDRELLGQGAGNLVSGLLGGLPIAGVIVRSSANVRAGARTRAAAVLHGVWIAGLAVAAVGLVERIPLAALAAVLLVVGAQLVRPRRDAAWLATVLGVVFVDLLAGVCLGLLVSSARRAAGCDASGSRPR